MFAYLKLPFGNLIHSSKTSPVCPQFDLLDNFLSMTSLSADLFLLAWVKTTNHNCLVYIHLLSFHQISNAHSECTSIRDPQIMKSLRITQISPSSNDIPKHICSQTNWKIRSHCLRHLWPPLPPCPRCPRMRQTRRKRRWRSWKMLGRAVLVTCRQQNQGDLTIDPTVDLTMTMLI